MSFFEQKRFRIVREDEDGGTVSTMTIETDSSLEILYGTRKTKISFD